MADAPTPQSLPPRHGSEYEDNHFHDDEEVAQPPADDVPRSPASRTPPRPARQLPPPRRRFHED